jgi:hypothetical protein
MSVEIEITSAEVGEGFSHAIANQYVLPSI